MIYFKSGEKIIKAEMLKHFFSKPFGLLPTIEQMDNNYLMGRTECFSCLLDVKLIEKK
ncbi:hypothetical protein NIES4072_39370 [Nostoc commune NIES-4072]|uniref:Uncharacterized protein n=1 Tax=Nostoc commune NIES-4072 TaxID=2005467 RepID=A0A2R5FWP7_NOSCO|nr:hypothetical protein NIES4072_39370 [Nostoc commune NIES-4072]